MQVDTPTLVVISVLVDAALALALLHAWRTRTTYPGFSEQLTATGSFTDGSTKNITDTVSWKAANSSIAVISNTSGSNGTITPVTIGTTPVTASLAGITGSTTLTVSKITTVPKAPTGVTINSSALNRTGQLAVSWPAVSGATSYNIYILSLIHI